MRLNSLSLQKKFSIRWRLLESSLSIGSGQERRGCCEIGKQLETRLLTSACGAAIECVRKQKRSGLLDPVDVGLRRICRAFEHDDEAQVHLTFRVDQAAPLNAKRR